MIDLLPNEDQQSLADAVAGFLRQELPVKRVRELMASGAGIDAGAWRQCAAQGWFGLGLPVEAGGVGYGPAEQGLLFRELGRHLTPGPVLGTVIAAHLAAADGPVGSLRDGLVSGELRANLATVETRATMPGQVAQDPTAPGQAGQGETAQEAAEVVIWHAGDAELLVIVDPGTGASELLDLRGTAAPGSAGPSIDPAYHIAAVPRAALPRPVHAAMALPLVRTATGLASAMLCGIAEAECDMNAEYVTRRIQFGHPIGSFQAVKHRAAESAVRAESAWCQTVMALLHCAAAAPDAGLQIASAKVVAAEAAVLNGRDNIQNHGAIGFTAEHDAHLFLKRAHLYAAMLGGPGHHLRALFDS